MRHPYPTLAHAGNPLAGSSMIIVTYHALALLIAEQNGSRAGRSARKVAAIKGSGGRTAAGRVGDRSGGALKELPRQAARVREAVAPDWLVDIVRPKPVTVPWPLMIRAGLAICVPLTAGLLAHDLAPGLLAAIGGLIAVIVDVGGPYPARLKRVGSAAVFGGAVGLTIGTAIHGRGWIAVVVLVLVAGASVVVSEMGSTGSVVGLQLLVYASLGLGPLGGLRPWWTGPLEFLIGVAWAMILIIPGWILYPRLAEQHSVAQVYRALAARLRSVGTENFAADRRALTSALNVAYDQLLTTRSGIGGGNPQLRRLVALLNHSFLVAEATNTLVLEGTAPPAGVADVVDALADSIEYDRMPPAVPPAWSDTPGAGALCDALHGTARLIEGQRIPDGGQPAPPGLRQRLHAAIDKIRAGRLTRLYALRLMASIGVAAVMSEILPLQRSYWVVLTVALVLKPDFGSVFARALQRGIGTIIGAVIGAVILAVVPYGLWLLIPFAILAALLPYGRSLNYALLATFLTPLVVLLIDILDRTGWHLAQDRLIDTLLGCAIALVIGFAPWPGTWRAHLSGQFAEAVTHVAGYTERALAGPSPERSRLRRQTYRELSDLRTEFQRSMSQPRALGRQATAWWPAVAALDQVMDMVTRAAVAVDHGTPAPSADDVRRLTAALDQVAGAVRDGTRPPTGTDLPDMAQDETLAPVADAIRGVQAIVA
jgi:uncharacterized membrane protein YccC